MGIKHASSKCDSLEPGQPQPLNYHALQIAFALKQEDHL